MRITKIGHCCLIIETAGKRILTDPGLYTTEQNHIKNIDIILITHEHGDHIHIESLKEIVKNNPKAHIVSNSAVAKLLTANGFESTVLEGEATMEIEELTLQAHDAKHAEIFEEYGQVQNTGYLINKSFFYPGDALAHPETEIEILAFPTAGTWANIRETVEYVLAVKPKKAFPVHDGNFKTTEFLYSVYNFALPPKGIDLILPALGKEFEI